MFIIIIKKLTTCTLFNIELFSLKFKLDNIVNYFTGYN